MDTLDVAVQAYAENGLVNQRNRSSVGNHRGLLTEKDLLPQPAAWDALDIQPNQVKKRLNPRWVETLMGIPVGWTMTSCMQPIASPVSFAMMSSAGNAESTTQTAHVLGQIALMTENYSDELRLLGNGVVPATAERAFTTLLKELTK